MLTYSIGELIDKLCVIHLKMWHIEEEVEKLKNFDCKDLEKIDKYLDQIVNLNETRVKIVDSINEIINDKE